MQATEVLIVFHCRSGVAEKLALSAAVGAVQNHAKIRLRRLGDVSAVPSGISDFELNRMRKEYVEPTKPDFVRADAIIFVAPAGLAVDDAEWVPLLDLLAPLHTEGKLAGKLAVILCETDAAGTLLSAMLRPFNFFSPPLAESMDPIETGRQTITLARNSASPS
jgi:hypothetical protein